MVRQSCDLDWALPRALGGIMAVLVILALIFEPSALVTALIGSAAGLLLIAAAAGILCLWRRHFGIKESAR